FPYRSRKDVTLDGVLIASGKALSANALAKKSAAIVNKNAAWPIIWRIEWNFDFYAPFCSHEVHALVRHKLRAACKYRLPGMEVEHGRTQAIGLHIGIEFKCHHDERGLIGEIAERGEHRLA